MEESTGTLILDFPEINKFLLSVLFWYYSLSRLRQPLFSRIYFEFGREHSDCEEVVSLNDYKISRILIMQFWKQISDILWKQGILGENVKKHYTIKRLMHINKVPRKFVFLFFSIQIIKNVKNFMYMDVFCLFYFIFSFIFISWRLITLQYCSGFCHTLTWISHGFTCIPHPDLPSQLPLHPIPLGLPSAPGPSTCLLHPAWAGDLFHPR